VTGRARLRAGIMSRNEGGVPTLHDHLGSASAENGPAAPACNLLEDVRRRHPGEELRYPHMRALDEAFALPDPLPPG
jgi:hypothetical protein